LLNRFWVLYFIEGQVNSNCTHRYNGTTVAISIALSPPL